MRNAVAWTVTIMDQYEPIPNILLSEIQSQPFAQYAKEHGGASWTSVSIDFEPLQLSVKLVRDRQRGDDSNSHLLP